MKHSSADLVDHIKQMHDILPFTGGEDMRSLGDIDYMRLQLGYVVTVPDGGHDLTITIGDDGKIIDGRIYNREEKAPSIKVSIDKLDNLAVYILGICLDPSPLHR